MSAGPSLKPMPTYRPGGTYSQENERRSRAGFSRELEQKHDKRSDLRVGQGMSLILTSPGFIDYAIGFDDNGLLTVTNYDTGVAGTFVIDWEDVQGLEQELLDLESEYQAADVILQAGITSNAGLITTNTASIASINTELVAARDGEANLSAKISAVETAYADGDSANATSIETLEASTHAGAQRQNHIPPEYQEFGEQEVFTDGSVKFVLSGCSIVGTSHQNDYIKRDAARFRGNSSQSFMQIRHTPTNGVTNMRLAPGRYAYKIAYYVNNSIFTDIRIRVRDSSDTLIATHTATRHVRVSDGEIIDFDFGRDMIAEGVLDLSSATEADLYAEIYLSASGTLTTSHTLYLKRLQLELVPDDVDIPGDWSISSGTSALVRVLKEAFVNDEGKAAAKIVLEAAASGGDPARLALEDGDGGTSIALDADQLFLGSDTTFEDTNDSFYTESGGERHRYGGPFGSSSDLLQWFGPDSVSLNSETKTNGYFALATDGIVYLGSDPADALQSASVDPAYDSAVSGASTGTLGGFTVSTIGGDGTYTYSTTQVSGSTSVFTIVDGTTSSPEVDWSVTPDGSSYEASFVTTVTETSTGRKAQVGFSVLLVTIAPP